MKVVLPALCVPAVTIFHSDRLAVSPAEGAAEGLDPIEEGDAEVLGAAEALGAVEALGAAEALGTAEVLGEGELLGTALEDTDVGMGAPAGGNVHVGAVPVQAPADMAIAADMRAMRSRGT